MMYVILIKSRKEGKSSYFLHQGRTGIYSEQIHFTSRKNWYMFKKDAFYIKKE